MLPYLYLLNSAVWPFCKTVTPSNVRHLSSYSMILVTKEGVEHTQHVFIIMIWHHSSIQVTKYIIPHASYSSTIYNRIDTRQPHLRGRSWRSTIFYLCFNTLGSAVGINIIAPNGCCGHFWMITCWRVEDLLQIFISTSSVTNSSWELKVLTFASSYGWHDRKKRKNWKVQKKTGLYFPMEFRINRSCNGSSSYDSSSKDNNNLVIEKLGLDSL